MRAQLYLDIQRRIQAILGDDNVPIVKHVDIWNRNLEFLEGDIPFEFPAVFIEFLPIDWETHGMKVQRAELHFKLHIVSKWVLHTASIGPDQDIAISYLDLAEKIYAKMQYNYAGSSNGFIRYSSTINHDHGPVIDSIDEYKTNIVNAGAADELQSLSNVTPNISTSNGNV